MVSGNDYKMILRLYNSKLKRINRLKFCEIIGISHTNSVSYKRIIHLLENIVFVKNYNIGCEIRIEIDRDKLEEFWRNTDFYKLTDDGIHKSTFGAITG